MKTLKKLLWIQLFLLTVLSTASLLVLLTDIQATNVTISQDIPDALLNQH